MRQSRGRSRGPCKEGSRRLSLCIRAGRRPNTAPSSFEKIRAKKGEAVVLITVRMDIVRRRSKAKRYKGVTLPAWLNKLGMEHNLNFSVFCRRPLKSAWTLRVVSF